MQEPAGKMAELTQTPVFNPAIFDLIPSGLAIVDATGQVVLANAAWRRLAREQAWTGAEVGGNYLAARQTAADAGDKSAEPEFNGIKRVQDGAAERFEQEYARPSPAGLQWFWLRVIPLGDGRGSVLLAQENITRIRQGGAAGRQREEQALQLARLSMDQVAEGFFWARQDGRFVNVNETACRQTGFPQAELLRLSVADIYPDWGSRNWSDYWREIKRQGTFSLESRCRNRAGGVYPVEISLSQVAWESEALVFMVVRDITERKLVEDEMFRSNDMLRAILDSVPIRVFWKDNHLVYQGCNQAFARDAGFRSPGEVIGATDFDTPWKGKSDQIRADDLTVIKTRSPKLDYEEFIERSGGELLWLKTSKVPLFDREGRVTGVLGTYEDITERKQFDKIAQQQARWNAFEAEVGLALSENGPLPAILQRCAEAMVRHLGTALARIWTLNPEPKVLELKASAGLSNRLDAEGARVPLGEWNIGMIAQEARPHFTNDLEGNPRAHDQEWISQEALVAFAGYPLMVENRVEGVLGLFSRQKIQEPTLKIVATVARALAQVIARHRAEQALRQSETRLSTFFRACPVGICICRLDDGRFIEVNEVLVSMLGHGKEELLAQNALQLGIWVDPADPDRLVHRLQEERRIQHFKAHFRRKSGVIGTMLVAAELIQLEGERHLLAILSDITTSEQQNEELRRAKEAADTANRAKSAFLANMSHEIRTPMNAILGYAQLMQRDPALPLDSQDKLNIINRSGQHLLALIEDVLEMSKIEAGRISVQPVCFNLRGMLSDLTSMFRLRAEAKGLEFKMVAMGELPPLIVADEGKFRQILINLLGNAIKFTHRGGVELRIQAGRREDRQWWLGARVIDTGVGMSAAELAKLFHEFGLAGDGQKLNEGTGLGLTISREYARLMGGTISTTSQPGQGSCFHLEIPVREGDHRESVEPANSRRVIGLQPGQPPVLILLADDNTPNRNWLKQLLLLVGCQVLEAANGEEAVRVWEKWKPQLILMDLQMPRLDGFEATRRIKALPGGGETVILALTATVQEESRRAILAAGAADLLGKPMEERLLFDKMQTHLGLKFIYESELAETPAAEEPVSPEQQAEWVAQLPAGVRAGMRDAIANGDLEGFEARLKEVSAPVPALARLLRRLAGQYDYDSLLRLLK